MKIQTLSVVVGTKSCQARCPYCVSKTTPSYDLPNEPNEPNWPNFKKALQLAKIGGATTVLLTGKGEPTLHPQIITRYLTAIDKQFPFIELQTNGMKLMDEEYLDWLRDCKLLGLSTICLSAVSIDQYQNREIYGQDYPLISPLAKKLTDIGFTVRLSIIMMKPYNYLPEHIERLVDFCKLNYCKQLTIRPVTRPENKDNETTCWIKEHELNDTELLTIKHFLIDNATHLLSLSHGAEVYDYKGQNICLANCLTTNETDEDIRQIIYYPDGTISYDWCYKGAVLL